MTSFQTSGVRRQGGRKRKVFYPVHGSNSAENAERWVQACLMLEVTDKLLEWDREGAGHQSSQSREAVLRKSLSKVPNISDELLEEIVHTNMKDPFVRAQEELDSEF